MIHARSRSGASIGDDKLRPIVVEVDDYRLWEAMAWVDEGNCRWVIETKEDLSADIKRAATTLSSEAGHSDDAKGGVNG